MAVFGIPVRARGRRAAGGAGGRRDARARSTALNKELERDYGVAIASRIGVNTGEVVAGDAGSAARRSSPATRSTSPRGSSRPRRPGEILIGEATLRLVARRGRGRAGRAAQR